MQTDINDSPLETQLDPHEPLAFYRAFGRLIGQLQYNLLTADYLEKAFEPAEEQWLVKQELANLIRGTRRAKELVDLVEECEQIQQKATLQKLLEAHAL